MKFEIKITSPHYVKFKSLIDSGWITNEKNGLWLIDLIKFQDDINNSISNISFGESILTHYWGFEIGSLVKDSIIFSKTNKFISYRPKMRAIVTVSQFEWDEVKFLSKESQFDLVCKSLLISLDNLFKLKKKPSRFNINEYISFFEKTLNKFQELNSKDMK
jgi:hypothetical protein